MRKQKFTECMCPENWEKSLKTRCHLKSVLGKTGKSYFMKLVQNLSIKVNEKVQTNSLNNL